MKQHMKIADLPWGKVQSAVFKIVNGLGNNVQQIVDRINSDKPFAERIILGILAQNYQSVTNLMHAREIMGKNMLGLDVAVDRFGSRLTPCQKLMLSNVPFSTETLLTRKDSHILAVVPTLSILDIRDKTAKMKLPDGQTGFFSANNQYDNVSCCSTESEPVWRLVRKTEVDNSTDTVWEKQRMLLGENEETPTAQVMVYTIIAYFLVTGERLFERHYGRCADLFWGIRRAVVGPFDNSGLHLGANQEDSRDSIVGSCSARKVIPAN